MNQLDQQLNKIFYVNQMFHFKKIKASKVINKGAIIMIAVVSPKVKYLSAEKKPIVPQKRAIDLKVEFLKTLFFEISPIVGKKISRIIINWPNILPTLFEK